ncbi:hypothetical protein MTR67_051723 [Solanum verrucosum]|uniref:Cytochrome P450 n=1 Tax=Solanum verrucosum TaxID=315347 RepID=A0AAF1A2D7_SOLVR|nr:hypothetical protein MTR67_051723 [Solanum verrucosum]
MHYLKAMIKQTLMLPPPIPQTVPRESVKDVNLLGYHIAAGTQVIINSWTIRRDPLSWENPEEHRSERRGCSRTAFAVVINELALARLVHKFNFALQEGLKLEDLDMTEGSGITIRRK